MHTQESQLHQRNELGGKSLVPPRNHTGGFQLTERDSRIFRDLFLYRYLNTKQISRLHFKNTKVAQRRLRKLFENRFIDRFQSDVDIQLGFGEFTYRLSALGAAIVADQLGEPPDSVRPPKRRPGTRFYLSHHHLLTDFRIWLREGCSASEGRFGYSFVPCYEEIRGSKGNRIRRVALNPDGTNRVLVPDGAFCLNGLSGTSALFTVEIDRGTEPLRGKHRSSITKKLEMYASAFDQHLESHFSKLFGKDFTGFRILFLVPTQRRLEGVLSVAREVDLEPLVWVALHQTVGLAGDLNSEVWSFSKGAEPCSLTI